MGLGAKPIEALGMRISRCSVEVQTETEDGGGVRYFMPDVKAELAPKYPDPDEVFSLRDRPIPDMTFELKATAISDPALHFMLFDPKWSIKAAAKQLSSWDPRRWWAARKELRRLAGMIEQLEAQ